MNTIKKFGITMPDNLSKEETFKFLIENKKTVLAEKKIAIKFSDALTIGTNNLPAVTKALGVEQNTAICVINTTNILDQHGDVHIPGLWNKSISDNKYFTHLQEHEMCFNKVISENSIASVKNMLWSELGYNLNGNTEALIFNTLFTGRNIYMEDQYRKGYVKNHSVGMIYVKIKMCINMPNDEYYKEEYSNWLQYIGQVVNKSEAIDLGMFWAVLEAKVIEGSAVVKGSNNMTPFLGMKMQPSIDTANDKPLFGTFSEEKSFLDILKQITLIN